MWQKVLKPLRSSTGCGGDAYGAIKIHGTDFIIARCSNPVTPSFKLRIIAFRLFPVSCVISILVPNFLSPVKLTMFRTLFVGILLLASPLVVANSSYELGVEAYQNKQYEKARSYWEDSAADGNLSAAFNLGLLLSKGIGGEQEPERAVALFRHVADSGLAIGQYNLALAYYSGKGIGKDNGQARVWWERAARQGHTQAQFNLGALLWNGDGVEREAGEAVKWFRKASDAGNAQASAFLDSILEHADNASPTEPLDTPDTDSDPAISALLQQAARAYNAEDYAAAFESWQQAARLNNAVAQYQLARLYREGWGINQDPASAFSYTEKSALQGLPQAQYRLAQYHLQGDQVEKNETLALYWIQSAADQGHIQAKDHLERLR